MKTQHNLLFVILLLSGIDWLLADTKIKEKNTDSDDGSNPKTTYFAVKNQESIKSLLEKINASSSIKRHPSSIHTTGHETSFKEKKSNEGEILDFHKSILDKNQRKMLDISMWAQLGSDINGEAVDDWSGHSLSMSNDGYTLAVGARRNDGNGESSGHVRIFIFDAASEEWVQLGSDIDGEAASDESGWSVSLSDNGRIVAIGARFNNGNGADSGHVRVFYFNESSGKWAQLGSDIDGEAASDLSGSSVSLSGDGSVVAIGARHNNGNGTNSGHVRLYTFNESLSEWSKKGGDIDGESSMDNFGVHVSLSSDGTIVAVGAHFNDGSDNKSGHVRVFHFDDMSEKWSQVGSDIEGEAADDKTGLHLSLSTNGHTLAIGAFENDGNNGTDSGHVRVYGFDATSTEWVQLGSDIDGEAAIDLSGWSVSLSGDGSVVAIGARHNDGNGVNSGHVRVYGFDGLYNKWTQLGPDIDGEAAGVNSGSSVALSVDGRILAIGAPYNDDNGFDSGHIRVFRSISEPSTKPSLKSSIMPSFEPTFRPTHEPSSALSLMPSSSVIPSYEPSASPSLMPSFTPSLEHSTSPSLMPSSSLIPSHEPIASPSLKPSFTPSLEHSTSSSLMPSSSMFPSYEPSSKPSLKPRGVWAQLEHSTSVNPFEAPTSRPSIMPTTQSPHASPTSLPSFLQSFSPSAMPTDQSSSVPSNQFSAAPSSIPTVSMVPSASPSSLPTSFYQAQSYSKIGDIITTSANEEIVASTMSDQTGRAVALSKDGTILAVSSDREDSRTGRVRVYKAVTSRRRNIRQELSGVNGIRSLSDVTWELMGEPLAGRVKTDYFGVALSLSDDGMRLAVSEPGYDNPGKFNSGNVRVFDYDGTGWNLVGNEIQGEVQGDLFGSALAMSGDGSRVAVGAYLHDTDEHESVGHVKLYELIGSEWFDMGKPLNGTAPVEQFGWSIALNKDGSVVAVGAPRSHEGGYVQAFSWVDTLGKWEVQGPRMLNSGPNAQTDDRFGFSVSLSSDGSRCVVGAPLYDGAGILNGGIASVFEYTPPSELSIATWDQIGENILGDGSDQRQLGYSVSISPDGQYVAVGASGDDSTFGRVYVHRWDGYLWDYAQPILSEKLNDDFGQAVSLSSNGATVAVGSPVTSRGVGHGYASIYELKILKMW